MNTAPNPARLALVIGFLSITSALFPLQLTVELSRGERPVVAELVGRAPSETNLRGFESSLERRDWLANALRPWMQRVIFDVLGDAGEKGLRGTDGNWLFYRPGARFLMEPWPKTGDDALVAIESFRDQLATRGVNLLLVPVPGKATVYGDRLTRRADDLGRPLNSHTHRLMRELRDAGIEALNLTEVFATARREAAEVDEPLYLEHDTHWSPRGVRVAAQALARRLIDLGWVERGSVDYALEPVTVQRQGDIVRMMRSAPMERALAPETVHCERVVRDGEPYADDDGSGVLILGDSFLRMYERDEPGSAGLIAHLARALGFPLASIVNDGGASTLVRQQLSQRGRLLEGKRVVIWQFVERDLRYGVDGWREVRLR